MKKGIKTLIAYCLVLSVILLSSGCSRTHKPYVSSSTELRDNTPVCLVPEAPGDTVFENSLVRIDISNASEGYITVTYLGSNAGVKLQITGPDFMPYTYDIKGNNPEVFPLSIGSGEYILEVFELIKDNEYSTILSEKLTCDIKDELSVFLYPNQYVNFNSESTAVSKAAEITATAHDDLEAINNVYNYIINTISYDMNKAENVQSGYIPNIDDTMKSKTGICLDYAAVMTSMLRSQRIPSRMEVGYAGTAYHAWLSAYAENIGWINGIVEFDGKNWSIMDPTVASNSGEEALVRFIGDGGGYFTKYIY